ncbi:MAG: VWA domain-containing protein [Polyangiaceae bacterium]|nr:VWA domain-containing protein [Polyangiaceae bacterium]
MSASSSFRAFFRSSRARRGIAACAVVLAAGGLVLVRAPSPVAGQNLIPVDPTNTTLTVPSGVNEVTFQNAVASGRFALSHGKLLAGAPRTFYGELTVKAAAAQQQNQRSPLSLAVVLDTSGSMDGDKIEQAKNSVIQLIRDMDADDEIAVIRYESDSSVVQPLARVGTVRESLISAIREIKAGGGTNIPPALQKGLHQLSEAGKGRVRRIVLVSDGLDSTRQQAEELAKSSAERGITVSSMGIGLDFDEAYMGAVARVGRGNFAFVKDASALAGFLRRELKEGATTVVEGAKVTLNLPAGIRVVRAVGADVYTNDGRTELSIGSLFAGDERRAIIEFTGDIPAGALSSFDSEIRLDQVGGTTTTTKIGTLALGGAVNAADVEESRNGAVYASAVSALASLRQLEATDAYNRGDGRRAEALIEQNEAEIAAAATAAPPAAATALSRQLDAYRAAKRSFAQAPAGSDEGKAAAKAGTAQDIANMGRSAF